MNLVEQETQPFPIYRHTKRKLKRDQIIQPLDPSINHIPLTRGQICIVDSTDYEWLNQWNWIANWCDSGKRFYAARRNGNLLTGMHFQIINPPKGFVADHIDSNGLNNTRKNLQALPHKLNVLKGTCGPPSKSGARGVAWDKKHGKWIVSFPGKWVGRFASFDEAVEKRRLLVEEAFQGYILYPSV